MAKHNVSESFAQVNATSQSAVDHQTAEETIVQKLVRQKVEDETAAAKEIQVVAEEAEIVVETVPVKAEVGAEPVFITEATVATVEPAMEVSPKIEVHQPLTEITTETSVPITNESIASETAVEQEVQTGPITEVAVVTENVAVEPESAVTFTEAATEAVETEPAMDVPKEAVIATEYPAPTKYIYEFGTTNRYLFCYYTNLNLTLYCCVGEISV